MASIEALSVNVTEYFSNVSLPLGSSSLAASNLTLKLQDDLQTGFSEFHTEYSVLGALATWCMGAFALSCLTYILTALKFQLTVQEKSDRHPQIPVVPYWIPGLCHAFGFIDPAGFLSSVMRKYGSERMFLARVGFLRFFVVANPEHVKVVFRNSKRTSNKSTTLFALRNIVNLPKEAIKFYQADDSGLSKTPRQGSDVLPENRINFLINHNLKKYLSADHLDVLNEKYLSILVRQLGLLDIGDDWVTYPDLHCFVQRLAIRSSVEAMAGSELFKLYPGLTEDIQTFQACTPDFLRMTPQWLMPEAYRVRKRLLQGMKRWHEHAHRHSDCSKTGPEDPNWEPYFGSRLIRVRQQYALKLEEMTADARASEDLGLLSTAIVNVVTSTFWFLMEAIKDPKLMSQLQKEVDDCVTENGPGIDLKRTMSQPLMQSTYAEVLRLYVAGAVSRVLEYEDINISGNRIPKDSYMVMYSRTSALDHGAWVRAGRTLTKPLDEFDAERFLVAPNWTRPGFSGASDAAKTSTAESATSTVVQDRRFSTDGLLGLWFPYGGGDHICPGQAFSKHIILLTSARLLTEFEFEFSDPDQSKVIPDMKYAPYGALPPAGKVSFRMRRKPSSSDTK